MNERAIQERQRIRHEYGQRQERLGGSDRYSPFNLAHLFTMQQRERAELHLLKREGFYPLSERRILEIGCGRGGILLKYLNFGASPHLLHGIDLLQDRVADAHVTLPHAQLACADGTQLPYADNCFDLVLQYTAFSSILDDRVKETLAAEMMRVLHKPNGLIVWYDFWLNPTNSQTRGIPPREIQKLFPGARFDFRRITLAPPIVRRLISVSWLFCLLLEKLIFLNTHYIVAVRLDQPE